MLEYEFSKQELDYYARQLILEGFGVDAQTVFKNSSILLIGVGGVGSPVATYLSGLGIGILTIVDDDIVNMSNLHRQVLFDIKCISEQKAIIAKRKLEKLNPYITINAITDRLTENNYSRFNIAKYDLIIDTSDNFNTKVLSNKLSVKYDIPLLSGGVLGFAFQAGVFNVNPSSACLNCLYPDISNMQHNSKLGVTGLIAAQAGLTLVNLLVNFFLSKEKYRDSILYTYNLTSMELNKYSLPKNHNCQVCLHS